MRVMAMPPDVERTFRKDKGHQNENGTTSVEGGGGGLVQGRMRCFSRVAWRSAVCGMSVAYYSPCLSLPWTWQNSLLDRDADMLVTIVSRSPVHSGRQACRHLHILEVRQDDGSRGRTCTRDQDRTEAPRESERKVAG